MYNLVLEYHFRTRVPLQWNPERSDPALLTSRTNPDPSGIGIPQRTLESDDIQNVTREQRFYDS